MLYLCIGIEECQRCTIFILKPAEKAVGAEWKLLESFTRKMAIELEQDFFKAKRSELWKN